MDLKNVSFVDMGLLQAVLSMIKVVGDGLCDYRVSSLALTKSLTIEITYGVNFIS